MNEKNERANKLREIISKAGLTQSGFSRRFGIPLRTVQGWCCGERECPIYILTMVEEILLKGRE